ncbi:periodic tryptophan protein 1 homolog [Actinia tenebrosa]|uniref:Periodic tryptophan protein 1 homolog n=1 Tax=Actinia tenebrosa TaxID=6105 RepID=A0A6P8HWP9_ACTTE|nr:periodic tryptophan protein 1 homolog [Actinia tenebrosa]
MIPCLAWVRRGVAKENPDKVTLSKEELKEVIDDARERLREKKEEKAQENNVNSDGASSKEKTKTEKNNEEDEDLEEILNEYDLGNYDDQEEEGIRMEGAGMAGLSYYTSNDEDPYVLIKDELDEDKDDFTITSTDNVIISGHIEDEFSNLEILLWNEEEDNYYVHHDILMDSFPLALEWIDFDPDGSPNPGNFVAVGTMEPYINIWDLDVIDCLEPAATLGKKKKKNKKKSKSSSDLGHQGAVLDLSWNHNIRNVLSSGSSDNTVILWDMAEAKAVHVLKHHKDKVQTLEFHPYEPQSLLTGSFDKRAKVVDCRSPESNIKSWKFNGEVEKVIWNHFSPFNFLASTDNGCVYCCDVRTDSPVFTINAHDSAIGGMSLSSQVPGCLLTASADNTIKVWDIKDDKPAFILSRDMKMGHIMNASCCPDSPFVFALGGEKQGVQLFNIMESGPVRRHFEGRKRLTRAVGSTTSSAENTKSMDDEQAEGAEQSRDEPEAMDEESASAAIAQLNLTGAKKKKKKRK